MNVRLNVRSYEYKNDYLYVIIRQAPEHGPRTFLFCSGIRLDRFDPLCRGTHGICTNPAFRGLQLLLIQVAKTANENGARPIRASGNACKGIVPPGEWWYRDSLLIENVPAGFLPKLLRLSVKELVGKVLTVCAPDVKFPDPFPNAGALQKFIESLSMQRKKGDDNQ